MNITEHEMRGLLTGKCIPGDIMVNEELPAYLVRKFAELKAQRDALAAENVALIELYRQAVKELDDTCFEMGMMRGEKSMEYPAPETPATDAFLNSVRAEGVEILTGKLQKLIDEGTFDAKEIGVAAGAVHEGAQISAQLRAGKDGE